MWSRHAVAWTAEDLWYMPSMYNWILGGGGSPEPTGWRRSATTQSKVILPYSIPDKSSFVFISYCLLILCNFKLKYLR